jgi:hypothetical protein
MDWTTNAGAAGSQRMGRGADEAIARRLLRVVLYSARMRA